MNECSAMKSCRSCFVRVWRVKRHQTFALEYEELGRCVCWDKKCIRNWWFEAAHSSNCEGHVAITTAPLHTFSFQAAWPLTWAKIRVIQVERLVLWNNVTYEWNLCIYGNIAGSQLRQSPENWLHASSQSSSSILLWPASPKYETWVAQSKNGTTYLRFARHPHNGDPADPECTAPP